MQRRYACSICTKYFTKPCLLTRHQVVHTKSNAYECEICKKTYSQLSSLQRHQMHYHKGIRKHTCCKCSHSFAQKSNLVAHIKNAHSTAANIQMYPCEQCSCSFNSQISLSRHITIRHRATKGWTNDDDDILIEDPTEFAQNVLQQLRYLQNDMATIDKVNNMRCDSNEQQLQLQESPVSNVKSLEITAVDDYTTDLATICDRLNPKGETEFIVVQCITRSDHQKYYVCEFCAKEFLKTYDFIRHRRIHTKQSPYKCEYCQRSFRTKSKLHEHTQRHILNEHVGILSGQHECPICLEIYDSIRQLDLHMKKHTIHDDDYDRAHTIQYICLICNATFTAKSSYSSHRCNTAKDKELEMLTPLLPEPICVKDRSFKCAYCIKQFKTRQNCRSHMKTHLRHLLHTNNDLPQALNTVQGNDVDGDAGQRQKCLIAISDNNTNQVTKLIEMPQILPSTKRHRRNNICKIIQNSDTPSSSNKYTNICRHCNKNFRKRCDLQRHAQVHVPPEKRSHSFTCDFCKKSFTLKSTLHEHIRLVHATDGKDCSKKITCQVCDKSYGSRKALNIHLRLHTGQRPFQCLYCDKCFRTSGHHIAHMRTTKHKNELS